MKIFVTLITVAVLISPSLAWTFKGLFNLNDEEAPKALIVKRQTPTELEQCNTEKAFVELMLKTVLETCQTSCPTRALPTELQLKRSIVKRQASELQNCLTEKAYVELMLKTVLEACQDASKCETSSSAPTTSTTPKATTTTSKPTTTILPTTTTVKPTTTVPPTTSTSKPTTMQPTTSSTTSKPSTSTSRPFTSTSTSSKPTKPYTSTSMRPTSWPPIIRNHPQFDYYRLDLCSSLSMIRDNRTNNILKGVCEVRDALTYEDAAKNCRYMGMDLLIFEKSFMLEPVQQFMKERYVGYPETWGSNYGLWINGKRTAGTWFVTKDRTQSKMNATIYPFTVSTYTGECLSLKYNYGLKVMDFSCGHSYWSLCEFGSYY